MRIIMIGSSTGGPKALETVLKGLPEKLNAIVVVVQHIPEAFAERMASRFDKNEDIKLPVSVVKDKELLKKSHVYVVPGQSHFFVVSPGYETFLVPVEEGKSTSIDMGFTSVAEHFGKEIIGVILTGMGEDGVRGAKTIKQAGGWVITQDQATSAVFGMPREVQEAGLSDEVLPLDRIPKRLVELVS